MTAFLVSGAIILAYWIEDHWIRAFYLWATISVVMIYSTLAATGILGLATLHMSTVDSLVKLSVAMIVFITATRIKKENVEFVFNVFCVFILMQCVFFLLQHVGLDIMRGVTYFTLASLNTVVFSGTLGNPNFFAACVVITMPLFFRKRWVWCLPILIVCLMLARTSGAVAAVIVGICYWIWKSKAKQRVYILAAVAVLVVVFFMVFEDLAFDAFRKRAWRSIIEHWRTWLPIGSGFGSYQIYAGVEHAHNDYLEAAFEGGFVHVICFLGFGITFLVNAWKEVDRIKVLIMTSLVMLGVNAFFNYPLRLAPSGFIALVLLGMYCNGRLFNIRGHLRANPEPH